MCYASPGPRCSSHARTDLKTAQMAASAANALLDVAATDQLPEHGALPAVRVNANNYSRLTDDYFRTQEALDRARQIYESTPEGIAGLKDDIAERRQALNGDVVNDETYHNLTDRLAAGQQARARQLAAFKAAHPANPPTPGGGTEDETEAAAAPPPCTCIEYRYRTTCAHVGNKIAHARRLLLPTSHEASLDAHSAAATFRKKAAHARTVAGITRSHASAATNVVPVTDQDDAESTEGAWMRMQRTRADFYSTPAGQAYIEAKIKNGDRGLVYVADAATRTGFRMTTWTYVLEVAQKQRVRNEEEFYTLLADATPQTTETISPEADNTQSLEQPDETFEPPELLYANPCSQRCTDFRWVGDCAHLGDDHHPASITDSPPESVMPPNAMLDQRLGSQLDGVTTAAATSTALVGDRKNPATASTNVTETARHSKSFVDRILGR